MRIILINTRSDTTVFVPLGILMIAACLKKKGHTLQVIDPLFDPINFEELVRFKPDLIGLSILTFNYCSAIKLVEKLKKILPNVKLVVGGVHPTSLPEDSLKELGVDFVVIGEGEHTIVELCDELEKPEKEQQFGKVGGIAFMKSGKVTTTRPRELIADLDLLPFPARELVDMNRYLIPPGFIRGLFLDRVAVVFTSRGCPSRCIFCNSNAVFGKRYRLRSVKNVIEEIKMLIDRYKITGIYFGDETFGINKQWTFDICEELKKLKLPWGTETRVTLVDRDILTAMKKSGCVQLDFGVESGSPRILEILKKGITVPSIERAFKLCKEVGIRTMATVMVGNPTETKKDINDTMALLKRIKPDFGLVSFITPFPDTELYRIFLPEEKKDAVLKLTQKYHIITSDRPLVNFSEMSDKELIEAKKRVQNTFMVRNYISLITLHNLKYLANISLTLLYYPKRAIGILFNFIKTGRFDMFVYDVLFLYQKHIQSKIRRMAIKEGA